MQTPIFEFVQQYQHSQTARFHMPGHKGQAVLGCEGLDITEIAGADNLQHPEQDGIIAQSEQNATVLFGTAGTYYSTGGSSACISAMLYLAKLAAPASCKGRILAGRNAHKVFLQSCALLDIQPTWLYPLPEQAQGLCACPIAPATLEVALAQQQAQDALPMAVYITSPDYLGNLADVVGLAAVCARYALPLLVDNAHGAYLKFLQPSQHPMDQGAAMCADSAHKTLPVLTGGAYLHIAKSANLPEYVARQALFCDNAKSALSLFSSTSPSYLIMQSLDLCNAALAGEYPAALKTCVARVKMLKEVLSRHGYTLCEGEPLKVTVDCRANGMCTAPRDSLVLDASDTQISVGTMQTGGEVLASYLRGQGIEVEFADPDFLVCMGSPYNIEADFARLESALCGLGIQKNSLEGSKEPSQGHGVIYLQPHETKYTLREALFSTGQEVSVENAAGKTCRLASVSCPPAIPIVVSGEVITEADVTLFQYYGIETVHVIKED